MGIPDNSGWELSFADAVSKFLKEAPIPSDQRRETLKKVFERNELKLCALVDLGNKGKLTAECVALARKKSDLYVRRYVQQPLKQLATWAASIDLLPHNPLHAWKFIPRTSAVPRRRAFLPDEIHGVLAAASEFDEIFARPFRSDIIFKTLLVTGNRPGAIFNACVGDLQHGRIVLPYGNGKKRNGMATIPLEFERELRQYIALRGNPKSNESLLVSPDGSNLILSNISHAFRRILTLTAVHRFWTCVEAFPEEADPMAVAELLYSGKQRGFDGPPPKDPLKIAKRKRRVEITESAAQKIGPDVNRWLEGHDMYALRKTHVSWARRLANADSVKLQVGHAPQDVEERHYLDLVDAKESSRAVWDILTGARTLDGKNHAIMPLALAAGAENFQNVDYGVDYGSKNKTAAPNEMSKSAPQVLSLLEYKKMKGVGIEPTTNGLKGRCSTD